MFCILASEPPTESKDNYTSSINSSSSSSSNSFTPTHFAGFRIQTSEPVSPFALFQQQHPRGDQVQPDDMINIERHDTHQQVISSASPQQFHEPAHSYSPQPPRYDANLHTHSIHSLYAANTSGSLSFPIVRAAPLIPLGKPSQYPLHCGNIYYNVHERHDNDQTHTALPMSTTDMQNQSSQSFRYPIPIHQEMPMAQVHDEFAQGEQQDSQIQQTSSSVRKGKAPQRRTQLVPRRQRSSTPAGSSKYRNKRRSSSDGPLTQPRRPVTFPKTYNQSSSRSTSGDIDESGRFICEACGKTFSRHRDCERHVSSNHKKDETYECLFCHKTFQRRDIILRHYVGRDKKTQKIRDCLGALLDMCRK
ncbi:hypothetical protein BX666DRAFT_633075 [Dichotomocladium elegans]|nr:hypothetical protein BX666DRAFT_633075 [Dichotomocladium elegans]